MHTVVSCFISIRQLSNEEKQVKCGNHKKEDIAIGFFMLIVLKFSFK